MNLLDESADFVEPVFYGAFSFRVVGSDSLMISDTFSIGESGPFSQQESPKSVCFHHFSSAMSLDTSTVPINDVYNTMDLAVQRLVFNVTINI